MKLQIYTSTEAFGADVLELLSRFEVQNNLPISFIRNERKEDTSHWLMAAVRDENGNILLTAAQTPPHNIVLFETDNRPSGEAVNFLCGELKKRGAAIPGVLAEKDLARRFAEAYAGTAFHTHVSMKVMRLDSVRSLTQPAGRPRPLTERDFYFAPYWERASAEDCGVGTHSVPEALEIIQKRLEEGGQFYWEDGGIPVSQAAVCRSTGDGAVIGAVYTPPFFRGKGYCTANVAALCRHALNHGYKYCCLFADAANPISCGIYHKIGFMAQCTTDEIRFDAAPEKQ